MRRPRGRRPGRKESCLPCQTHRRLHPPWWLPINATARNARDAQQRHQTTGPSRVRPDVNIGSRRVPILPAPCIEPRRSPTSRSPPEKEKGLRRLAALTWDASGTKEPSMIAVGITERYVVDAVGDCRLSSTGPMSDQTGNNALWPGRCRSHNAIKSVLFRRHKPFAGNCSKNQSYAAARGDYSQPVDAAFGSAPSPVPPKSRARIAAAPPCALLRLDKENETSSKANSGVNEMTKDLRWIR